LTKRRRNCCASWGSKVGRRNETSRETESSRTRLVLLGLDGATWDLILPWAEQGYLPALADLLRSGAWGPLASTRPPASFPAWSTLLTGVHPGKHGIYDFTQRLPGTYRVAFLNATHRRAPSLWQLASQAGRCVAALGFPATYPPEPVNGLLVSGFDSPVATGIDRSCVYPPERYAEIAPYPLGGIQEVHIDTGWHERALRQILLGIERRTEVALGLLQREHWDLFALHYGESDTAAHHFWAFYDTSSPRHDPAGAAQFGDALLQVYRAIDAALNRLLAALPPEATVAVVSDHGTGGAGEWIVHLNRWLEQQGWLRFGERKGRPLAAGLRRMGLCLPERLQEWAFRGPLRGLVDRVESQNRLGGIDWEHTAAFSEEVNTLPGLWLNVQGREPAGIVGNEEYDRLRSEIVAALQKWPHPETGEPLLKRAWRREDLYHGPWVHLAPDIVLEPALDRGYSSTFLGSSAREGPAVRRLAPEERLGAKGGSMNGSHRPAGILILSGAGIQAGTQLEGTTLADIVPTTLAVLGLPQPAGGDGRVLREAFRTGFLHIEAGPADGPALPPATPYTSAEEKAVEERLRGLGYRE
jgi:predicted AlkP superfamily phosphohydrolase/phosphomutase